MSIKHDVGVVLEHKHMSAPTDQEWRVAKILARHFKSKVVILDANKPGFTPDLMINDQTWEIKSPSGRSKYTIQNNLRQASKQAFNVIVDLSRSSLSEYIAIGRIRNYLTRSSRIKQLLVITKDDKVICVK